jgi:hypothetical protein
MASILDFSGDPKKKYGAVAKKDTIFISDPQEYKLRKQAFADSSYAFNKLSTALSPDKNYEEIKNAQVAGAKVPYKKPQKLTDLDKKKLLKSGVGYKGISPVEVMKYDEKAEESNVLKGLDTSVYSKDGFTIERPWYKDPTQVPVFQEKPEYVDPFTIAAKKIQEIPIDSKSRVLDLPDINYINQQEAIMDEPFMESYSPQMSKPSGAAIQGQRRPDYGRQVRNAAGEKSTRAKLIDLVYDEEGNVKNKSLYGKYKNEIAKMNADENYLMNLSPLPDGEMSPAESSDSLMYAMSNDGVDKNGGKSNSSETPKWKLKAMEMLSNPKTDEDVQEYMNLFFETNKDKIDAKTISSAKKEISQYINSPEYAQRQANFPEQYVEGGSERYQKKKFETSIAKAKREERLKNLNTVPVVLTNDGKSNYYAPDENKVFLNQKNIPSVVSHEITHASAKNIDIAPTDKAMEMIDKMSGVGKILPESDRVNTQYWDSIVSKKGKKPVSSGLNIAEMDKFVELAKPADERSKDVHFSNITDPQKFSSEQYGDLMGVRSLLYKSGITKSFGEKLDKDKLDKALNNSKIKADPVFKRFLFRYGPENTIELNNTIAKNILSNDGKSLMDVVSA